MQENPIWIGAVSCRLFRRWLDHSSVSLTMQDNQPFLSHYSGEHGPSGFFETHISLQASGNSSEEDTNSITVYWRTALDDRPDWIIAQIPLEDICSELRGNVSLDGDQLTWLINNVNYQYLPGEDTPFRVGISTRHPSGDPSLAGPQSIIIGMPIDSLESLNAMIALMPGVIATIQSDVRGLLLS